MEGNAFIGVDCDEQLGRFMGETNLKFAESGELLENYKPSMKFSNQIINPFVSLVKRQYEEEEENEKSDTEDIEIYKQNQRVLLKYNNFFKYLFLFFHRNIVIRKFIYLKYLERKNLKDNMI